MFIVVAGILVLIFLAKKNNPSFDESLIAWDQRTIIICRNHRLLRLCICELSLAVTRNGPDPAVIGLFCMKLQIWDWDVYFCLQQRYPSVPWELDEHFNAHKTGCIRKTVCSWMIVSAILKQLHPSRQWA